MQVDERMGKYPRLILMTILTAVLLGYQPAAGSNNGPQAAIQPPQLLWQNGGCYSSWCETGWYASPAVVDLDGDGRVEVVGGAYSIFILDGSTGDLIDRLDTPGSRIWPGVVVGDIQEDGKPEIVIAQGGGYLTVYNRQGQQLWSRQPTPGNELRSLAASDLDQNGKLELIVASTRSEDQWYVYESDGSVRSGQWPQHGPDSDTNGYAAGCFNENVAAGDLDGDGLGEIIGPNDTHYIAAFNDDGSQMLANTIFGTNPDGSPRFWSRVGFHVDQAVDIRGYAHCGVEHRPNFANSAPTLADVNQDGVLETIVVGNVYNCGTDPYTDLYEIPYILNADRTRWKSGPYDWTVLPSPDGNAAPLSEDYNRIENNVPNPVAVDLDGNGNLEILYPSYDGRMHAFWLDKTEHGNWPFTVTNPEDGVLSFASEPVVVDLDNNGKAEVIFTTWVEKGSQRSGKLYILDDLGNPLQVVDLPPAYGGGDWNGAMAAPTQIGRASCRERV